jgi:hypothetical protein
MIPVVNKVRFPRGYCDPYVSSLLSITPIIKMRKDHNTSESTGWSITNPPSVGGSEALRSVYPSGNSHGS